VPASIVGLHDVLTWTLSVAIAVAFVLTVVFSVRWACRHRLENSDRHLPVLIGFVAAGSVSALVAALL
jgi:hypothetical protein